MYRWRSFQTAQVRHQHILGCAIKPYSVRVHVQSEMNALSTFLGTGMGGSDAPAYYIILYFSGPPFPEPHRQRDPPHHWLNHCRHRHRERRRVRWRGQRTKPLPPPQANGEPRRILGSGANGRAGCGAEVRGKSVTCRRWRVGSSERASEVGRGAGVMKRDRAPGEAFLLLSAPARHGVRDHRVDASRQRARWPHRYARGAAPQPGPPLGHGSAHRPAPRRWSRSSEIHVPHHGPASIPLVPLNFSHTQDVQVSAGCVGWD